MSNLYYVLRQFEIHRRLTLGLVAGYRHSRASQCLAFREKAEGSRALARFERVIIYRPPLWFLRRLDPARIIQVHTMTNQYSLHS